MKKIKKIYYIFVFAIIFNLLYFTTINVKAFNTDESDPTSQMTYYVESKENIIYYDIEADSFEVVYLETGLFKIYEGEQYPLTRGYIIRNDEEIFYSVPNSDVYPFSMFSDNLAIILTSNLEWFCFLYDYDENQYAYYNESENKYYFVDIEFDYDFYSFERNYQLYSKQFDGDVSNKITRSEYFENLKDNIGINETGSCAYVSLGILLGYYDIFVNDNIIENDEMYLSGKATKDEIDGLNEETYVKSETINNSFDIENCLESPGTTNAFHNFLLYEIGRKHFDYHDDTAPEGLKFTTKDIREYELKATDNTKLGEEIIVEYEISEIDYSDSKYNDRKLSLSIMPTSTNSIYDSSIEYNGNTYYLNYNNEFIIPLSDVQTSGKYSIKFIYKSPTIKHNEGTCDLNIKLIASATSSAEKPHLGQTLKEVNINLTTSKKSSLKVESMSDRVIKNDELKDIVELKYNSLNVTGKVTLELQEKIGEGYTTDSTLLEAVNGSTTQISGKFTVTGVYTLNLKFSQLMPSGNYQILFTVYDSLGNVERTVTYKFVVVNE